MFSLGLLAAIAASLVFAISAKVWRGGRRSSGSTDALHHRIRGLEADLRVAQRAADDALERNLLVPQRLGHALARAVQHLRDVIA